MISDNASRVFAAGLVGRPLAMAPEAAATAFDVYSNLDLAASAAQAGSRASGSGGRPYDLDQGIATIPVHGEIARRSSWLAQFLGWSSYEGLMSALAAAIADSDVRGVILDFDSPGGELAGATEAASAVRAASARKPIVAFVDSVAASAAYVIAAATKRVFVTPSATVGSIGVVYLHLDQSDALARRGVKPTILHGGAFKVDGNPYKPLPADARKRVQGLVDSAHDLIVQSVGRHRAALGAAGARKTEAGLYMGQKAVAAGLADAVGTIEDARKYLQPASSQPTAHSAAYTTIQGEKSMSQTSFLSTRPSPSVRSFVPSTNMDINARNTAKRLKRQAEANAKMELQLQGESLDDFLRASAAKVSGATTSASVKTPSPARPAPPAAEQTPEDRQRELHAKYSPGALMIRERYR